MGKKKPKVQIVTLSPELDDGSRKTIETKTICTCNEVGTAELILYKIKDSYKELTDHYTKNSRQYFLTVGY